MSDARRTRFNTEVVLRGLGSSTGVFAAALNHGQIDELMNVADAANVKLGVAAVVDGSPDVYVLAPAASQATTITITAGVLGTVKAAGLVSVQVVRNGSDALAVTYVAGVLTISYATTTGSNNTLTKVKAAIDAAVTGAASGVCSTFITGAGSTQFATDTSENSGVLAPGSTPAGGIKSITAGKAQAPSNAAGAFTVTPA